MFFKTSPNNTTQQHPKPVGEGTSRHSTLKRIVRYSMMPGIMPRLRALGMHFGHFAYLIALVLNSARLIPLGHPALNASLIGTFGVRDVLAIAANNIKLSWRNIDQIAIFSSVVLGLILIVIQAVMIAFYAFLGTAHAQSTQSFFETPPDNVPTDVVLIFLDQVFGANLNIFGAASEPTGTPVYLGLQAMLGLYSMATMVIAVIIVVYYILTVIGEAAKTGTPFGQRFNSLWAPIRLIVALGLLVPLGSGLNSAQYITLWTAKMGSGLATQVWIVFANSVTSTKSIISKPAPASTTGLVSRIFLSEVCAAAYNQIEQDNSSRVKILQALKGSSLAPNFSSAQSMVAAAKQANMISVVLSWSDNNVGERANDYTCGYITVSLADFDFFSDTGLSQTRDDSFWEWIWGGRDLVNKIGQIHRDTRTEYIAQIGAIAQAVRPAATAVAAYKISVNATSALGNKATLDAVGIPAILQNTATTTHNAINTKIIASYEALTGSEFSKSDAYQEMIKRGWGAAGLWYGNITKINQKYMDAINASAPTLGTIISAPNIRNAGRDQDRGFFEAIFGSSRSMSGEAIRELDSAVLMAQREYADTILRSVPANSPLYQEAQNSIAHSSGESGMARALIWILGGDEMYSLKNNPSLDPMARIAGAGHAILFKSFTAFGIGAAATLGSAAAGVAGKVSGKAPGAVLTAVSELSGAIASLFFVLAGIALVAGVFLAYIIPLMPFIYFVFAVIAWVLEIFEAIVAMPLWALAHLRIDGDGMPGQAAISGYQLLLMILIRPTLIVFGLIGGYVIFGAAMFFFSTLYNSATSITQQQIAGSDIGAFGVFIYTIIFAFLAYNIATMCFKMIDDVPKGMLRWLGSGTQTFGDSRSDPISGSREMLIGAVASASALKQGLGQTKQGVGKAMQRHKMRKGGMDPDNPVQDVNIVSQRPDG